MAPTDVPAATRALFEDNWGDRHVWFDFATTQAACRAFVADVDGRVVGTAVGTENGSVGWIGTIWVDPMSRRAGIGRALTEAVIEALDSDGCRTLVLVATDQGLPMYERMGFEHQARYQILEIGGLPDPASSDGSWTDAPGHVTAFAATDAPDLIRLDRAATGEDRAHAIERFANPESTKVLRYAGELVAFVIRAPWGGGATIASSEPSALRILGARRVAAGPSGRVRVGVVVAPDGDPLRLARLAAIGLQPVWSAPRLVRGDPLVWRPDSIWGQFNHAMG